MAGAVGPLTNIALALRTAPDLHGRIAGISVMGGGTFGNREPVAEFNVWADPEAAAVVFDYGGPLVMAGLDLTHQFVTTPERIDAVRQLPGRLAAVLGDLFVFFADNYISRHDDIAGAAVHDPCAVLALTHPDLFARGVPQRAGRDVRRAHPRDDRDRPAHHRRAAAANCDVLVEVDADAAWEVVLEAIASFSR